MKMRNMVLAPMHNFERTAIDRTLTGFSEKLEGDPMCFYALMEGDGDGKDTPIFFKAPVSPFKVQIIIAYIQGTLYDLASAVVDDAAQPGLTCRQIVDLLNLYYGAVSIQDEDCGDSTVCVESLTANWEYIVVPFMDRISELQVLHRSALIENLNTHVEDWLHSRV